MKSSSLEPRLRRVGRRLLLIGGTAGAIWGLAGAILLLLAGTWFDLLWEMTPRMRIATWAVAVAGGATILGWLAWKAIQAAGRAAIARRLDRVANSGGRILSGLDLDRPGAGVQNPRTVELTQGMAGHAVASAAELARRVSAAKAVPAAKPVGQSLGAVALIVALVGLAVVCLPRLAWTQWNRFARPYDDVPPFSWTQFEVEPGHIEVLYGSQQDIRVKVTGTPVENVELVLESGDGRRETLPMFPESDGRWRTIITSITEPGVYFVRSYHARSTRFNIRVLTVPRIENVRVVVTPPSYTRRLPYKGPVPKDGLSGLPGTKVRVWAQSNRPLSRGTLVLSGSGDPVRVKMQTAGAGSQEVIGQFEINADGRFELDVTDVDGQSSQEPFAGTITLLNDEHPFIRLMNPPLRSLATPTTPLPVALSAEDDYGVARVSLYRSLNDSRALPVDLEVDDSTPRRADVALRLPLADFRLEPGDVIKLFGRVEDNDPAGAKGAETPVATIQIISQKDFERLLRIRKGLEVLVSKYREAQRRMESLADEIEQLKKKLEEAPSDSPLSDELRRELERLLKRLDEESKALRKLADSKMPYDIDKRLSPLIGDLSSTASEARKQLAELLAQAKVPNSEAAKRLAELLKKLNAKRAAFRKGAMLPMELLEKVMPLLIDQTRFVILAQRQRDLAERLASLKGRDGEDEPSLKARMRNLEEEQHEIREDLHGLMEDILDHAEQLPDESEFNGLGESARQFVQAVRATAVSGKMSDARSALSEFAGTRAHKKAVEAADILDSFIARCEGLSQQGRLCLMRCSLRFQPSLGGCLGNTIDQLLAEFGMGGGSGFSAGLGMGRGVGLYGEMPGMAYGSGRGSDGPRGMGGSGDGQGMANPDAGSWDDRPGQRDSGGIGSGSIPVRYRRRVGLYFQRLVEELQEP